MANNSNTQAERLGAKLQELRVDITASDRLAAMAELRLSKFTISNYLSGRVLNNDTAAMLIGFFTKRISDRDKVTA